MYIHGIKITELVRPTRGRVSDLGDEGAATVPLPHGGGVAVLGEAGCVVVDVS